MCVGGWGVTVWMWWVLSGREGERI